MKASPKCESAAGNKLETWRIFNMEDIVSTVPLPTPDLVPAA
jgi:hypothetical protein